MNVEKQIVEMIRTVQLANAPQSVLDKVSTILLHDLAMGIRGSSEPWPNVFVKGRKLSNEGYTLLGRVEKTNSLEVAVQYNATSMASTVMEDFWQGLHAGPIVIAAVVGVAEREGLGIERVLEAILAGYETGVYLQELLGDQLTKKGLRSTPLIGAMAASCALAKLVDLGPDGIIRMLGVPASLAWAAAYPLVSGTEEWIYQAGFAAQLAVQTLEIAEAANWLDESPIQSLINVLGVEKFPLQKKFRVLGVGLKRHPVNILVQPAVGVSEELASPLRGKEIETITVFVPDSYLSFDYLFEKGPFSHPLRAVLSIPVGVAFGLLEPGFSFRDLYRANEESVQKLVGKVEIVGSDKLTDYECTIKITSSKGLAQHTAGGRIYHPTFDQERKWLESKGLEERVLDNAWGEKLIEFRKSLKPEPMDAQGS